MDSQETEQEVIVHAATSTGLIWKPRAAARRLSAATLRGRCCSWSRYWPSSTQASPRVFNVLKLSSVTGHKDLRILKCHHHPRAEDLAKKLAVVTVAAASSRASSEGAGTVPSPAVDPAASRRLRAFDTAALTRGERIALSFGPEKRTATLPTGRDAIELGGAIYGPLVGEVLASITWPLAHRHQTSPATRPSV